MSALDKLKLHEVEDRVIEGTNLDMLPTPASERTWAWWKYVCTWAGPSFDINQWNTGSSFITVGLTVSQATAPVMLGSLIATLGIVFMGFPGSRYHVGFPSLVRPTFGTSASKFIVGLRGLVGVIWYGIEAYYVSTMVNIMIRCMAGDRWYRWDPVMPSSAGTTAQTLISFFITWILIFPLVFVHPKKMDHTFVARMIFGPLAYIVLFAWCAHIGYSTPGGFEGFQNVESAVSLKGSALGWAIISGINSIMGTISPQTTNVSDITRYARSTKDVGWPQGVAFWITKVISIFLAIFSASFLYSRYGGTVLWNVWDQLDLILDQQWGPASRAGVFFIALGFAFSSTTTNAYANTVPFGADISCLLPQFFNMRRGQILIALLSLCTLPWRLFTSGAAFLNFLGSYSFFMASVAGPMFIDYFVIRRGNYHVPSFYKRGNPSDIYTYNKLGANWRGLVAFGCGVIMILPGLVSSYNDFSTQASHMYSTGWLISAATSAAAYYAFNKLSPVPLLPVGYEQYAKSLRYEQLSETEGLMPEEFSQSSLGYTANDVEDHYIQDNKEVAGVAVSEV